MSTEHAAADPHAWATSLVEVLHGQIALVDELAALAERQGELISGGRSGALLELLERRQTIIDKLLATKADVARRTDQLPQRLSELPPPLRGRVRGLVQRLDERLAHVIQLDQRDQEALAGLRDRTRDEITATGKGRSANAAYLRPSLTDTNRYADRRG